MFTYDLITLLLSRKKCIHSEDRWWAHTFRTWDISMTVIFWEFGLGFGWLLVLVFLPKISRWFLFQRNCVIELQLLENMETFQSLPLNKADVILVLVFVHWEISLVRQDYYEVGILDTETMSYIHTFILMCQMLYSFCGFHKQGFDNILKPSFLIVE